MKKILSLFFLAFSLASCQYFDKRVPTEEELLKERLKEINWKEVTVYPSIAECDSLLGKEEKKQCFFTYVTQLIQQKLNDDSLNKQYPNSDTIQVRITVFPDSKITFEPQFPSEEKTYSKEKIDSIIQARLVDFPKIEPAQKEGIPVKTEFILPVILKLEL